MQDERGQTPPRDRKPEPQPTLPGWGMLIAYALAGLVLVWLWQQVFQSFDYETISYRDFKRYLTEGEVVECSIGPEVIKGKVELPKSAPKPAQAGAKQAPPAAQPSSSAMPASPAAQPSGELLFRTIRVHDPKLIQELDAAGVEYAGVEPSPLPGLLLSWGLPLGLLAIVWLWISRKMSSVGQAPLGMRKSQAHLMVDRDVRVTFADVAGCDEAKLELAEVVEFLRKPERFEAVGATIPKGVLLVGPPGTGKTLLARAVAGEAGVDFYSLAASGFVEMFVGVGAARVRDLFQQAKAHAPCIVFIDELDAIGRARGVSIGNVNDEREHTLNQLLVEMDGFAPNSGVILLAATNRPDVLDPALLRPGRFDRQVVLDAPDMTGREAILRLHARRLKLARDVDLGELARATPGFSGADLANVINEAALLAARRRAGRVAQRDLEEAVEKVVSGPERRSRRLDADEKRRVAYHETGHALVAVYSRHADPVHKISIVPRGRAALGYTLQLPAGEHYLMSRAALLDRLRGLLGGRAAEEIAFDDVSTGAENDLEMATGIARRLVCEFGMGQAVGLMHCARHGAVGYLRGDPSAGPRDCSDATAHAVDQEVRGLLDDAYAGAHEILAEHRDELDRVAAALLEHETLDQAELHSMLALPADGPRVGSASM